MGRLKTVANNVMLYVGLIGYTAIGAKVRQTSEKIDEWKTFQGVGAKLVVHHARNTWCKGRYGITGQ